MLKWTVAYTSVVCLYAAAIKLGIGKFTGFVIIIIAMCYTHFWKAKTAFSADLSSSLEFYIINAFTRDLRKDRNQFLSRL